MAEPKFEKVNDNVIRIIIEKSDEVSLARILENKKQLLKNKEQILEQLGLVEKTLKNIEEIIVAAKELGVVPEPPKSVTPKKDGK